MLTLTLFDLIKAHKSKVLTDCSLNSFWSQSLSSSVSCDRHCCGPGQNWNRLSRHCGWFILRVKSLSSCRRKFWYRCQLLPLIIFHKPKSAWPKQVLQRCSHSPSRSTSRQSAYGIRPADAGPDIILQRRHCKFCSAAASVASALRCGWGVYAKRSDRLCILKYRFLLSINHCWNIWRIFRRL